MVDRGTRWAVMMRASRSMSAASDDFPVASVNVVRDNRERSAAGGDTLYPSLRGCLLARW
jgi:hypothetical protein